MAKLISVSIDVTKLDKNKFIRGKKGTYADLTISLNDQEDQYGNTVSIWQAQTKEERDAKERRNFLGNGKVIWENDGQPRRQSAHERAKANGYQPDPEQNSLPF